jgi:hypothetical protein
MNFRLDNWVSEEVVYVMNTRNTLSDSTFWALSVPSSTEKKSGAPPTSLMVTGGSFTIRKVKLVL